MEQYFVESFRNSWKIKFEGSYVGIFPTREAAIGWAIKRAHNANARGERASVLTRGYNGLLRVEWTSPEGKTD